MSSAPAGPVRVDRDRGLALTPVQQAGSAAPCYFSRG